ncbi:hypothetical protein NP493_5565g00000 [Ridgeia piscesae]|uniref:EF-hand domain-containing protein n=1 Tax=Ridgeia piscesae TaxID=27915 RepID=A0AAD9IU84_RIDPI|nr:hypothetical protein NP493_5565g00000 [Ridgeia piscesae]
MAYYLYFTDHLRDARINSLCIRHVPRFESGGPERGWVSTVRRRKCNSSGFCWTISLTLCNRKRRSVENRLEDVSAPQAAVLSHYDTDKDGQISRKEFEQGLDDDVSFEEALLAHIEADLNGDGFLSCEEFLSASFPFELVAERSCL